MIGVDYSDFRVDNKETPITKVSLGGIICEILDTNTNPTDRFQEVLYDWFRGLQDRVKIIFDQLLTSAETEAETEILLHYFGTVGKSEFRKRVYRLSDVGLARLLECAESRSKDVADSKPPQDLKGVPFLVNFFFRVRGYAIAFNHIISLAYREEYPIVLNSAKREGRKETERKRDGETKRENRQLVRYDRNREEPRRGEKKEEKQRNREEKKLDDEYHSRSYDPPQETRPRRKLLDERNSIKDVNEYTTSEESDSDSASTE